MSQVQRIGDLELGEDMPFQEKMWRVQRVGWVVMGLVILAALIGLLGGQGPASRQTAGSEDSPLRLTYEQFVHAAAPVSFEMEVDGSAVSGGTARIWVSRDYLQALQLEKIVPEPERVQAAADRLIYEFAAADSQPLTITFQVEMQKVGSMTGSAGIEGGSSVDFNQFVYP